MKQSSSKTKLKLTASEIASRIKSMRDQAAEGDAIGGPHPGCSEFDRGGCREIADAKIDKMLADAGMTGIEWDRLLVARTSYRFAYFSDLLVGATQEAR